MEKVSFLGVRSLLTGKITSVTLKRRAPKGDIYIIFFMFMQIFTR